MSTTSDFSVTHPQKRKRTVVSYAQFDQLADLLSDGENDATISSGESSGDDSENDDRTYSRRRKTPKKLPKKKKARHTRSRQQPEQKPFPFMELPPELRDMIYEMALTDVGGISIVAKTKAYRRDAHRGEIHDQYSSYGDDNNGITPKTRSLVPNLLAVNKQIHNETVNMLYGQKFFFKDTDALHRFLAIIGLRNQQRLLHLDVTNFCTGRNTRALNHCAFMSLAGATNLKTLRLHNDYWYYSSAKGFARGLYSDAHYFLEGYGAANGRKDAAIDILQLDDRNFESFHGYSRRPAANAPTTVEENRAVFRQQLCRMLGAV
ncbi:hypothetical protein Q7P37_008123 [Cladosporium fusiforme]